MQGLGYKHFVPRSFFFYSINSEIHATWIHDQKIHVTCINKVSLLLRVTDGKKGILIYCLSFRTFFIHELFGLCWHSAIPWNMDLYEISISAPLSRFQVMMIIYKLSQMHTTQTLNKLLLPCRTDQGHGYFKRSLPLKKKKVCPTYWLCHTWNLHV